MFSSGLFATENHYDNADSTSKWSVRAANEMGGLGEAAEAKNTSAVKEINSGKAVAAVAYYNMDGTRVSESCRGQVIKVTTMTDGTVETVKIMK